MKKLFILLAAMCVWGAAQAQVAAALPQQAAAVQDMGSRCTVSAPTKDGKWIAATAAAEQPNNDNATELKNTIAIYLADKPNDISDKQKVCNIGVRGVGTEGFIKEVNFEVHSIVQSCNPDTCYVLCGSISRFPADPSVGMIAILNSQLELVSLRRYPHVRVFYDVYAQDGFYFTCGQMQSGLHNSTGIVLRDNLITPILPVNIFAYYTVENPNWAFHKIEAKNNSVQDCPAGFSVLGADDTETKEAVFQIENSVFIPIQTRASVAVARIYIGGYELEPRLTKKYKESEINKEVNNN